MTALLLKDGLMFVKKCKMYLVFTVFFALTGVVNLDENVFFFFFLSAIYLSMAPLTLLGLEEAR